MADDGSAGATRLDDDELLGYARTAAGREHGLSEAQSKRLVGGTLRELHPDAAAMTKELGVDDPYETGQQARDESGRFARATRYTTRSVR
jgi:hypothetical protein